MVISWYSGCMKIIAHRGAKTEKPENTLAAFEQALKIGVDGIEADLLMTRDQRVIVRHDDLIQTPEGQRPVKELTLKELQQIDLGGGERIPTLEEFLKRFLGRSPITLDLKAAGMVPILLPLLSQLGALDKVHMTSFLHADILQIGQEIPESIRSIVFAAVPINYEPIVKEAAVRQVSLFRGYLTEETVRQLGAKGIRVWVYPVNVASEAKRFARWGVDAIFTDDPRAMLGLRGSGNS